MFFSCFFSAHYSHIILSSVAMGYVILDTFISARPIRIFQVYQPMLYIVVYAAFTYADQSSDNKPLYNFIDWSDPEATLSFFVPVLFVAVPILHTILFGIHQFRNAIPAYESSSSNVDFVNNGVKYSTSEEVVHF